MPCGLQREHVSMSDIAYQDGSYLPRAELKVSVEDPGFVLGITVNERLRTFDGKLFRVDDHLRRLRTSLRLAGFSCQESDENIRRILAQIVGENYPQLPAGSDLAVVLLCSPSSLEEARETVLRVYTTPLAFHRWADLYSTGQRLIVSQTTQVPSSCWPAELKCRSRMHFYRADCEARQRDEMARALLVDTEGFVAEASSANVFAFFCDEGVVSPPPGKIILGISLSVVAELSEELGLRFSYRDVSPSELMQADEVMLCSTSPCVQPVTAIDGVPINGGEPGNVFRSLIDAWSRHVGVEIVRQAQVCSLMNKS